MTDRGQLIANGLIRISDRCSEALANADDPNFDVSMHVSAINRLVWELRWDIGLYGGDTKMPPDLRAAP